MKDFFGMAAHIKEPFERDRSDRDDDPELKMQVEAKLKRVLTAERASAENSGK